MTMKRETAKWVRIAAAGFILVIAAIGKKVMIIHEVSAGYLNLLEAIKIIPECGLAIWLTEKMWRLFFGPDPAERTEGGESRWVQEWSEEE